MESGEHAEDPPPRPLAIAHAGGKYIAAGSRIGAARRARQRGADGWEFDIQPTADRDFVVHHDPTLEDSTDARIRHPDRLSFYTLTFSLQEILELEAENGEQFCTLDDALALNEELAWFANLDLKVPPFGNSRAIGRALARRLPQPSSLLISSFDHESLAGTREIRSDLRLGLLTREIDEHPLKLIERFNATSWHPKMLHFDEALTREVLETGVDVFVWTVNDPDEIRLLCDLGVTGIISDFPERVAAVRDGRSIPDEGAAAPAAS